MSAGAVGHAHDPDFAGSARVAVSRKADPRLVRQGQHLEPMFAAQREEQLEREVAWNAKNVGDADLAQIGDHEIAQGHPSLHTFHSSPADCSKGKALYDGANAGAHFSCRKVVG